MDANKVRLGPDDALALLDGVETMIAMRGAKVDTFDLKKHRPDDDVLLGRLMGPSGNLRAPTARIGKLLLVGFNEETYAKALGTR